MKGKVTHNFENQKYITRKIQDSKQTSTGSNIPCCSTLINNNLLSRLALAQWQAPTLLLAPHAQRHALARLGIPIQLRLALVLAVAEARVRLVAVAADGRPAALDLWDLGGLVGVVVLGAAWDGFGAGERDEGGEDDGGELHGCGYIGGRERCSTVREMYKVL